MSNDSRIEFYMSVVQELPNPTTGMTNRGNGALIGYTDGSLDFVGGWTFDGAGEVTGAYTRTYPPEAKKIVVPMTLHLALSVVPEMNPFLIDPGDFVKWNEWLETHALNVMRIGGNS